MESDFEDFDVTDRDLNWALDPDSRKHGRKLTKEEHTYGVWASEEGKSGSYNFKSSFNSRSKQSSKSSSASYFSSIGFISGGVSHAETQKEDETKDSKEISPKNSSDEDSDEGQLLHEKVTNFKDSRNTKKFGEWERHTKGIGQKLLLQMGYQIGKGLGKNSQGIAEPVMAYKRQGKGAIGAYGPERPQTSSNSKIPLDQSANQKRWKKSNLNIPNYDNDLHGIEDRRKESNNKSLPFLNLSSKSQTSSSSKSNLKIIDMTGPKVKTLTNFENISNKHLKSIQDDKLFSQQSKATAAAFDIPELRNSLTILVNMCEKAVARNTEQVCVEQENIIKYSDMEEKLALRIKEDKVQIKKLEAILDLIRMFDVDAEGREMDVAKGVEKCKEVVIKLITEFGGECRLYKLSEIFSAVVIPMLREFFQRWPVFQDFKYGLNMIKDWQVILEKDKVFHQKYDAILWKAWLPPVRRAILDWNCKECNTLLNLFEFWFPLLPSWIIKNINTQLILPKLQQGINDWNPVKDVVPVHTWIHPWLPILEDELKPIFDLIRFKIGSALSAWHPSDSSAKLLISPWKEVWSSQEFDQFIIKYILPKLNFCLANDFVINPKQQIMQPWNWIMDWRTLFSKEQIDSILYHHFWPKWHGSLRVWLALGGANFNEISMWYNGWKNTLVEFDLDESAQSQMNLSKALLAIDNAMNSINTTNMSNPQTGTYSEFPLNPNVPIPAPPNLPQPFGFDYSSNNNNFPSQNANLYQQRHHHFPLSHVNVSFKEILFQKASELSITHFMLSNRMHDGNQIYQFGHTQIYIHLDVVYMLCQGFWKPISMNDLIAISLSNN